MRAKRPLTAMAADAFEPDPWQHLLWQLDVILIKVQGPVDAKDIHPLSLRRRSTAARNLALERRQVLQMMEDLGVHDSHRGAAPPNGRVAELAPRCLELELHVLAQAFEACAKAASMRRKVTNKKWLFGRSQIHQSQALFLSRN